MENQKGSARARRLLLVDMSSAFVVLGIGISFSLLVFLTELVYERIKAHYFIDKPQNKKTSPSKQEREIRIKNRITRCYRNHN